MHKQSASYLSPSSCSLCSPLRCFQTTFSVTNCVNLTFADFELDSVRVPFTYGQVVSSSAAQVGGAGGPLFPPATHPLGWQQPRGVGLEGTSVVAFDASLYPIDTAAFPWLGAAQAILSYDPATQRIADHATDIYALTDPIALTYGPAAQGGGANETVTVATTLAVGSWVILRHQVYAYNSFTMSSCEDVLFSNVGLLSAGGMGLYADSHRGRLRLDGFAIYKAPYADYGAARSSRGPRADAAPGAALRPMSLCADGAHFSNPAGATIEIVNSLFEGQGDDGINIPTIFQEVESMSADGRSVTVGRAGVASASTVALAGGLLNFFNRTNLAFLLSAEVLSVAANGTVTMASPLPPAVQRWTLLNNPAFYADTVLLANTTFRANRARGALLKQSNVLATNNTFDHTSGAAIKTETDGCYWYVGSEWKRRSQGGGRALEEISRSR